jgi:hypothetical protein
LCLCADSPGVAFEIHIPKVSRAPLGSYAAFGQGPAVESFGLGGRVGRQAPQDP